MSRHDQLEDRRQQLLGVESLVAVASEDQRAHAVVARRRLLRLDQRSQHRHNHVRRLFGLRVLGITRGGNEKRDEASSELVPVGLGNAEKLTDHRERQRKGERGDEVDPAVGPKSSDAVEEVVDDHLHSRTQLLDPARREGGGHQPSQPCVIGWVGGEHVPGKGLSQAWPPKMPLLSLASWAAGAPKWWGYF